MATQDFLNQVHILLAKDPDFMVPARKIWRQIIEKALGQAWDRQPKGNYLIEQKLTKARNKARTLREKLINVFLNPDSRLIRG